MTWRRPAPPSHGERATESRRAPVGALRGGGAPGLRILPHRELDSRWTRLAALRRRSGKLDLGECDRSRRRRALLHAVAALRAALARRGTGSPRPTLGQSAARDDGYPRPLVVRPLRVVGALGLQRPRTARGRSRAAVSGAHLHD